MSLDPQELQALLVRIKAELDGYFDGKKQMIIAAVNTAVNTALANAGVAPVVALTTAQALALVDAVKLKGVRHFIGYGLDVEFPPVTP